jgi:hypothetical protein
MARVVVVKKDFLVVVAGVVGVKGVNGVNGVPGVWGVRGVLGEAVESLAGVHALENVFSMVVVCNGRCVLCVVRRCCGADRT